MSTSKRSQVEELERELKLRLRVYPRWVQAGKLKQEEMDHRVACLTDAIAGLRAAYGLQPQQQRELEL
jgi:hypothetical protein